MPCLALSLLLLAVGCGSPQLEEDGTGMLPGIAAWPEPELDAAYAKYGKLKLSEYGFFQGPLRELNPAEGVLPYAVASPLFSDYAGKSRFVYLPAGESMDFREREVFGFPVGSVLIKHFYYSAAQLQGDEDLILETRLLLHESEGWKALPYVWNAEQTEAFLDIAGGARQVSLPDKGSFRYSIPTMQQCKSCHEHHGAMRPIGPVAHQLDFAVKGAEHTQLQAWHGAGLLEGLEDHAGHGGAIAYGDHSQTLQLRARSYLDSNCAYCHNPAGSAKNSGLDLRLFAESDYALGIGKKPVAAGQGSGGLHYDIVPGQPEASILYHRMASTEPAVMMPELGRSLVHEEGLQLIHDWIAALE